MATPQPATESQVQDAVRQDRGTGDIAASAPRSKRYRNEFGQFVRPVANPRANEEAGLMTRQIAELGRLGESGPAPVAISSPAKWLFRTDPGHRVLSVRIPGVPQMRNQEHYAYHRRVYERRYTPEQQAEHERLHQLVGGLTITFQHMARRQECYLETDEPEVATFILTKMLSGELPQVYQDTPTTDESEQAMPSHRTQAAMRLRLAAKQAAESPDATPPKRTRRMAKG